jgi:hypothetical protein
MKEYEVLLLSPGLTGAFPVRVQASDLQAAKRHALRMHPGCKVLQSVSHEKFKEMARARGLPVDPIPEQNDPDW